ncbi:MAG: methyltransferase domain-containing protein [Clostridia bacterium]
MLNDQVAWDPDQYHRFATERSRPFRELVAAIDVPDARRVADLGCGDGSLTMELADRWPGATVTGIDKSPEMIASARTRGAPEAVRFELGDLRHWRPPEAVDVLVSNAALQWVPGHVDLFGRFADNIRPGGCLAFQVPGNFQEPSHQLFAALCASPYWRDRLGSTERPSPGSHTPREYLDTLLGLGLDARVWETTYYQRLQGERAVLEWMKGTTLRPVLAVLEDPARQEFLDQLGDLLEEAYPPGPYGTVFPFHRIFAVARVPGFGA